MLYGGYRPDLRTTSSSELYRLVGTSDVLVIRVIFLILCLCNDAKVDKEIANRIDRDQELKLYRAILIRLHADFLSERERFQTRPTGISSQS